MGGGSSSSASIHPMIILWVLVASGGGSRVCVHTHVCVCVRCMQTLDGRDREEGQMPSNAKGYSDSAQTWRRFGTREGHGAPFTSLILSLGLEGEQARGDILSKREACACVKACLGCRNSMALFELCFKLAIAVALFYSGSGQVFHFFSHSSDKGGSGLHFYLPS